MNQNATTICFNTQLNQLIKHSDYRVAHVIAVVHRHSFGPDSFQRTLLFVLLLPGLPLFADQETDDK